MVRSVGRNPGALSRFYPPGRMDPKFSKLYSHTHGVSRKERRRSIRTVEVGLLLHISASWAFRYLIRLEIAVLLLAASTLRRDYVMRMNNFQVSSEGIAA